MKSSICLRADLKRTCSAAADGMGYDLLKSWYVLDGSYWY